MTHPRSVAFLASVLVFMMFSALMEQGIAATQIPPALPLCKTRGQDRLSLRLEQRGRSISCVSRLKRSSNTNSSSSSHSSLRSSSSSSSSSSKSSAAALPLDTRTDTEVRSQFLLLGETSAIIGAAKVFLYEEPLVLTKIVVNLTSVAETVQSLSIYDQDRHYLGRALLDPTASTNRRYLLTLPAGAITIPQRVEKSFYARANLRSFNDGGQSNQAVQVSDFTFYGQGEWSTGEYVKSSSDTFLPFKTARASITSVTNPKDLKQPLVPGTQREIGTFRFTGRRTDQNANIRVTDIVFTIEQTGNVQITSPRIGAEGLTDTVACIASSTEIACSSIPDTYLSLDQQPRTIRLYADITVPGTSPSASLRLSINETGSATSAGAVTWTDGTTNFTWVPGDGPIAQGTYFSY